MQSPRSWSLRVQASLVRNCCGPSFPGH
uniref:Uncharacterized protein n=1 Tax=Arundo donax TaxID=35708 RepID=A0A0A9D588_ARUDO